MSTTIIPPSTLSQGQPPIHEDYQVWFATIRNDEITMEADPQRKQEMLVQAFANWHDPIPRLIASTPPDSIVMDRAVAHKHCIGPAVALHRVLPRITKSSANGGGDGGGTTTPSSSSSTTTTGTGQGPCMVFVGKVPTQWRKGRHVVCAYIQVCLLYIWTYSEEYSSCHNSSFGRGSPPKDLCPPETTCSPHLLYTLFVLIVQQGDAYMTIDPILAQGFTVAMEGAAATKAAVQKSCEVSDPRSNLAFDPYRTCVIRWWLAQVCLSQQDYSHANFFLSK
jgi:hypothetical protein